MFCENIKNILFCHFLFTCVEALRFTDAPVQDLQTTRVNTLSDDADDLQKQLDNEARDRIMFGRPKTLWIFHVPIQGVSTTANIPTQDHIFYKRGTDLYDKSEYKEQTTYAEPAVAPENKIKDWNYQKQNEWNSSYPECGGRFQSPVDLPFTGMIQAKASRKMLFGNYNAAPKSMTVVHDGKSVSVVGNWDAFKRPIVYGGAAHSRRYRFQSLAWRWPSEHMIGGLYYPLESQAMHVSAEYSNIEEAVKAASRDKLALLVVSNIYKHSKNNHKGLEELMKTVQCLRYGNQSISAHPLGLFSPPLKEYAAYYGSLTTPPCTESVLWLVRARSLPITRDLADTIMGHDLGQKHSRLVQPLNDRKIYYFS